MRKIVQKSLYTLIATALFGVAITISPSSVLAAEVPLSIANMSFETGGVNSADGWATNKWGNLNTAFSVPAQNAQNGQRSARIDVTAGTRGDARWEHAQYPVTAGVTYTFSDWYMSNVPTVIDVAVKLKTGTVRYYYIATVPASSTWKQSTATFKMPANATSASFFHLISSVGYLQTDNYVVSTAGTTTTPPPAPAPAPSPAPTPTPTPTPPAPSPVPVPAGRFTKPIVSIEFDDGWTSAYLYGLPTVESFGWKPTQYIVTDTAVNNANYGIGTYMTPAQIIDWNARGNIGSHTVTHDHIPQLTQSRKTAEIVNSKMYLDSLLQEPTNLYVSPYCESSQAVVNIVKNYYQSLRNCEPVANTAANFDRWNLKSFIVLNTTTDAELRNILTQTKAQNGWLILVWHEIDGDFKNSWSVSQTTLRRQLQIVKDSGIAVIPTQEALNASL